MTGPQHYLRAEQLMGDYAAAVETVKEIGEHVPPEALESIRSGAEMTLRAAHVHATLALAAATAVPGSPSVWSDAYVGRKS